MPVTPYWKIDARDALNRQGKANGTLSSLSPTTASTDTTAPTLSGVTFQTTGADGLPAFVFNGSATLSGPDQTSAGFDTSYAVVMTLKPTAAIPSGGNMVYWMANKANQDNWFGATGSSTPFTQNNNLSNQNPINNYHQLQVKQTAAWKYNGSNVTISSGQGSSVKAATGNLGNKVFWMGDWAGFGLYNFFGEVQAIAIVALADVAAEVAQQQSDYGIATGFVVVFGGDSFFGGAFGGQSWPSDYTCAKLPRNFSGSEMINAGGTGWDLALTQITDNSSTINAKYPGQKIVYINSDGSNDISGDTSVAASAHYANFKSVMAAAKAAGWYRVARTVPPRQGVMNGNTNVPASAPDQAAYASVRAALNALMIGDPTQYDVIVRLDQDPHLGPDTMDTTYWRSADLTHPTDAGGAIDGNLTAAAIMSLPLSGPTLGNITLSGNGTLISGVLSAACTSTLHTGFTAYGQAGNGTLGNFTISNGTAFTIPVIGQPFLAGETIKLSSANTTIIDGGSNPFADLSNASVTNNSNVTAPAISSASFSPNPTTTTQSNLTIGETGGTAPIIFSAAARVSPSGGNIAFGPFTGNATVATVTKAGTYNVTASVVDANGYSDSLVSDDLIVTPTLTTITVSPSTAKLANGANQTFTVATLDQFGNSMANVGITGNITLGNGTLSNRTYTSDGKKAVVTFSNGSISGTARINFKSVVGMDMGLNLGL